MGTTEQRLDTNETLNLIAADKVEGTDVYDRSGEKIGTVENVMIDKLSGKVAYAVMSFGGFLGMGKQHHPLPWSLLTYDTEKEGYVTHLDKNLLKDAPAYDDSADIDWSDGAWSRKIDTYYNSSTYRQ